MSTLSRRHFLQGALALGGALALPAFGDELPILGGQRLPDPDFARLRRSAPYIIGVRPHRKGGVRLELADAPLDGKQVVHNYGHGGAGITLSWGCASVAVELVEQAFARLGADAPHSVAVLGTGVIGLTTATELRRRFPTLPIRVYARSLDLRTTTSFIAGGQFEPSGIFHEYESEKGRAIFANYVRRAHDRIAELERSPQAAQFGVAARSDFTLDHENRALDVFTPSDVVAPAQRGRLPFAKLNIVGKQYRNWLMNPTLLLPRLVADLKAAAVQFVERGFESAKDVAALDAPVIVNCTGLGAKALFGDDALVPQRGHLVALERTDALQNYFFSGGCANPSVCYVFCRQDDIVVGGTVVSGDANATATPADAAVFARVLANAKKVFAGDVSSCR